MIQRPSCHPAVVRGRLLARSPRPLALVAGIAIAGIIAMATGPTAANATTAVARLSLDELTERSDLVVHGTVESIRFEFVPEKGPFTRIEIALDEVLAGNATGETVTVRMYGGEHDGKHTRMDGAPCLGFGEEVVLFLAANGPDTFNVVNLAEGKFAVDRSTGSAEIPERDLSGIVYLDSETEPVIPRTLDAFAASVRAAAE